MTMATTKRYMVEFEAANLRCDLDAETGKLYVWARLPSGGYMSFGHEADDRADMGHVYSGGVTSAADRDLHDRLTAIVDDGCFKGARPRADLIEAVRAAGPAVTPTAPAPDRLAAHRGFYGQETAAILEAEGTPLAPAAVPARPRRTCIECGSPVYSEYCTHCMEG
jgi:hypothetical protein